MITCPHCGQEFSESYTIELLPQAVEEMVTAGLPKTKAKRARTYDADAIADALIANPQRGHRIIAKMFGVSRTTVYKIATERGIVQDARKYRLRVRRTR